MTQSVHTLLARQIRRHFGTAEGLPANLVAFLEAVNDAYRQSDLDRSLLERALDLSSNELFAANFEMRAIFLAIPDLFFRLDGEGMIRELKACNSPDLAPLRRELVGNRVPDLASEPIGRLLRGALDELRRTSGLVSFEFSLAVNGTTRCYEARLVPLLQEEIIAIVQEITERKRMHAQLVQAQKLESIGHLAAGIAHEINTPTQYVGDNTRFLKDAFCSVNDVLGKCRRVLDVVQTTSGIDGVVAEANRAVDAADLGYLTDEIPRAIQQSLEGIDRVSTIVRAMKDFAHPHAGSKIAVDLNRAITSTITVAQNEWKYVANAVSNLDPNLPPVCCLPSEINQVVLNLICNAAHAIKDAIGDGSNGKGTIRVSTRLDGENAEIRVADTGCGIPKAIRSRIFDPFFTTKEVGRGTGQGLTIARSVVVDKHGGTITFETEEGKGTTFVVRLPIRDSSDGTAAAGVEA